MRTIAGVVLFGVSLATAWSIFMPILVYGEVTYVEPIAPIAWLEFGFLQLATVLGITETVRGISRKGAR